MGKGKTKNILYFTTIILLILTFIIIANPKIIGHAIEEQYEEYSDSINIDFDSGATYSWTPKNNGNIVSIKITGTVAGEGDATVYFEGKLAFDNDKLGGNSLLTGNVIEENETIGINETNETVTEKAPEVNTTVENSTGESNITIIENATEEFEENITVNETLIENSTGESNITIIENATEEFEENITVNETPEQKEPIIEEEIEKEIVEEEIIEESQKIIEEEIKIIKFENICEKTCALQNLDKKENYSLKIALTNAKLKIEKITYKIKKEEEVTNLKQKEPEEKKEEIIEVNKIQTEKKEEIQKKSKVEKGPIDIIKITVGVIAGIAILFVIIKNNLPKKKTKKKRKTNKKRK